MKICFLSSARYQYPLEATTEKKFRLLSTLGELFVVGFSNTTRPQRFTQHAHFITLPGLPIPLLRYILFFLTAPWLCLWNIFRHHISILVAQGPYEGAAAALAKIIAGWFGQRVVVCLENHGDFEESLFMQRRIRFRRCYQAIMTMFARFAISRADLFRAVSNSTRQQLERWRPGCHIFQFLTWTDIDLFFEVGDLPRNEFSPIILYAGVLIPRKGVIHLINAFARLLKDFPVAILRIVGKEDNPAYANELKVTVSMLGLQDHVTFLEAVPQQTLAHFMAESGIFVLPSYSEGLPRVVFEAMAAGLPVIATNISGIPDVVEDGATGFLIQPGDEAALEEKLRWMLMHQDIAVTMGKDAHHFAKKFFSPHLYLENYRMMFETSEKMFRTSS